MLDTVSVEKLATKFFNLPTGTDAEVAKVARDMQKQDSLFHFIPSFVSKNGFPRWDKVFYKVRNSGKVTKQRNAAARETVDSSSGQGLFFIPLQGSNDGEILSYIACYKHNDSLYSYKLFNKDSLNIIQPVGDTAKTKLLNALALFSFFEKNINGVDSISVGSPVHGYLKNVQLEFSDTNDNRAGRGESTMSFPSGSGCSYTMVVTETFTYLEIYVNGYLTDTYSNYTVHMAVTVICTGDEGSTPSGGGGGGWYWYNYGTGTYYDPNLPTNGQYWWTNALGGGVGQGSNSSQVQYLINSLPLLTQEQTDFLQSNSSYANELYNMLSSENLIDENVLSSAMINLEVERQGLIENWNEVAFKIILENYLPVELRIYKDIIIPHIRLQYAIEANNEPGLTQTFVGRCKLLYNATKEILHLGLDIAGLVPVIGEIFDLGSATLYLLEGDGFNASLSAASALPVAGWFAAGIKAAKRTIVLSTGAKTTLKWVKSLDGKIVFGDRGQLRKILGLAEGDTRWAHHMIPWESANHDLIQKASMGNNAFHLNEALNGIPLNLKTHKPPHNIYNGKILDRLDQLWSQNGGANMTTNRAEELVRSLNAQIKNWILANPYSSINDIIL